MHDISYGSNGRLIYLVLETEALLLLLLSNSRNLSEMVFIIAVYLAFI